MIEVEVVYAEPARQDLRRVSIPEGATVADAIEASGLEQDWPTLEIDPKAVGVFGRKAPMSQTLKAGDRVEIYRPLLADPKEVRRARAEAAKADRDA